MEILETKAYSLPFINIDQNSTLMFESLQDQWDYFEARGIVLRNNVVKDVWRLYVDYLMLDGDPYPKAGVYNYFRFTLKRGGYLFFYVYDYEVKGAGQILYKLKLDTLQTYYLNTSDFQPIGEQLVLREHKDRFDANKEPIIDKTLESLDIKPSIVERVVTYYQRECKLALTKVGGGVYEDYVLSKASYFWKVYSTNPVPNKLQVNKENFELLAGWGVGFNDFSDNTKGIMLRFVSETGEVSLIFINQMTDLMFRYGLNSGGNQILYLMAGEDEWDTDWYVAPQGVLRRNPQDLKELQFSKKGRLYIVLPSSTGDFSVWYDIGIYENSFIGHTLFDFTPNTEKTAPFLESNLNPQAVETQQIISIPHIMMLDEKGFGTSNGDGIYIPLNKEISEKVYDVETTITNLIPSFQTEFYEAMTRIKHNDPKLLHSQFNTLFFTLQNEQIPLKLENTRNDKKIKLKLNLNTSNYSKGLLKLENSQNNMIYNELYELEKVVNMNNEYAVIKSEINDYIDLHARNDQRLNELQISKAERDLVYKGAGQLVTVAGGAVAGAVSGTMVGGPVGTVAGAVVGAAASTVKGVLNIAQGIQNLNQLKEEIKLQYDSKIKSLAYSLINITGLTPDLAEKQDVNKLKLFQFKLLDYEKDYLDLFFHKYGYQTLEFKIPNLRSRLYFNFIQMELINYRINNRLITAEIVEDIKLRFRAGVTLYHYNDGITGPKVDWEQQLENYERKFYE